MSRNRLSSDRIENSNLAQVGRVDGDVVFNNTSRDLASWIALVTVVVLLIAAVAVWQVDSLRIREIAGEARAIAPVAPHADDTASTTPTPAPEVRKALAPFDITAQEVVPTTCQNGRVVPDTDAKSIPAPPDLTPPGAVLGDGGQARVTVQGRHDTAVVLISVRIEVVSRRPAMPGIYLTGICGSSVEPRFFDVDLARPAPTAVAKPGRDGAAEFPAVSFPYKVSATEPEVLVFTALSPDEDVEWRVHLLWSSAGETRETPVDLDGKPFRTTSTKAAKKWCWTYDGVDGHSGWIVPEKVDKTRTDWCP